MFILKKNKIIVGKGYTSDGMLKLNIDANKVNASTYLLSSFNVWHFRLCHIKKRRKKV